MNFHIFAKTQFKDSVTSDILSKSFTIQPSVVKQIGGKAKALEYLKSKLSKDRLIEIFNEENILCTELIEIELVTETKGQWVDGKYFAHEYGLGHCAGRARAIKYSNGFKECEVQCLDSTKSVCDGIWEWSDCPTGRVHNGFGDHFEPKSALK